jgi:hypothetical protein
MSQLCHPETIRLASMHSRSPMPVRLFRFASHQLRRSYAPVTGSRTAIARLRENSAAIGSRSTKGPLAAPTFMALGRVVPQAAMSMCSNGCDPNGVYSMSSSAHPNDRRRHLDAKSLGSFAIDHQLVFCGGLGKVRRFLAFEKCGRCSQRRAGRGR